MVTNPEPCKGMSQPVDQPTELLLQCTLYADYLLLQAAQLLVKIGHGFLHYQKIQYPASHR